MYSFGTYTRETETLRCSSISFTSLRASSTGCTFERNARPKTPSNRDSSFDSIVRSTLMPQVSGASKVVPPKLRSQSSRPHQTPAVRIAGRYPGNAV